MTDRLKGCIVVFDRSIRDDDAEKVLPERLTKLTTHAFACHVIFQPLDTARDA